MVTAELAKRPLHITQREVIFPLHYALEWGAPVDSVRLLLRANPGAAGRCKGEHLPVNRAIDTALNLFTVSTQALCRCLCFLDLL